MRPTLMGRRWFWGVGAIFAGALLAAAPVSRAYANDTLTNGNGNDSVEVRTPEDDDDADFQKQIKDVEKGLNELLSVDEDKKVHVKKEFADSLPMPAAQIERMLQMSVKVGDDGKIKLRNPEQIRPFLPQIQGFLKGMGGTDKLKELSKKSPEERKALVEKMMKEQGLPAPNGGNGGGDRGGDRGGDEGGEQRRPRRDEAPTPPTPPRAPRAQAGGLEDRVGRLEKAIERIERMVKEMAERGDRAPAAPRAGARGGEPQGPEWHQENWGWRAEPGQGNTPRTRERSNERGSERAPRQNNRDENRGAERGERDGLEEGMRQAERAFEKARAEFEKRIRELHDRFQRNGNDDDEGEGLHDRGSRNRDREERDDEAPRGRRGQNDRQNDRRDTRPRGRDRNQDRDDDDDDGNFNLSDLGSGARDVFGGLRKVGEVMTAEDWQMIARTITRLTQSLKPGDLQDQGALMQKLQAAVDPQDMPRFLEIAGKVLGSPEGQAMQKRLDSTIRRVEKLQEDGGLGGGEGMKGLQGLFGNKRSEKAPSKHESEPKSRHSSEPKHLAEAPSNPTRPANARLY